MVGCDVFEWFGRKGQRKSHKKDTALLEFKRPFCGIKLEQKGKLSQHWLAGGLVTAMAFDGSPDIHLVTKGQVALADLGQPLNLWRRQDPFTLWEDGTHAVICHCHDFMDRSDAWRWQGSPLSCSLARFDWSFCLEVSEHLPSTLTPTFLANLDKMLGLHIVVAECLDFRMIRTKVWDIQCSHHVFDYACRVSMEIIRKIGKITDWHSIISSINSSLIFAPSLLNRNPLKNQMDTRYRIPDTSKKEPLWHSMIKVWFLNPKSSMQEISAWFKCVSVIQGILRMAWSSHGLVPDCKVLARRIRHLEPVGKMVQDDGAKIEPTSVVTVFIWFVMSHVVYVVYLLSSNI